MDRLYEYSKLEATPRTQLQQLCKRHGLKATGKTVDLIDRLSVVLRDSNENVNTNKPNLAKPTGVIAKKPPAKTTGVIAKKPPAKTTKANSLKFCVMWRNSSPYDSHPPSKERMFATQEEANDYVKKEFDTYKSGYSLEDCKLYKNNSGFLRFYMRDQEGTVDEYWSCYECDTKWTLIEKGKSEGGFYG